VAARNIDVEEIAGVVAVAFQDRGTEVIVVQDIVGEEGVGLFLLGQGLAQGLAQELVQEVFLDHFLGHVQELVHVLGLDQILERK